MLSKRMQGFASSLLHRCSERSRGYLRSFSSPSMIASPSVEVDKTDGQLLQSFIANPDPVSASSNQPEPLASSSQVSPLASKTCPGCGAAFQNSSKLKAGYLPPMNLKDRENRFSFQSHLTAEEEKRAETLEKSSDPISPQELKLLLRKRGIATSYRTGKRSGSIIVCWKCHSSGHRHLMQNQHTISSSLSPLIKTNRTQFADLKLHSGGLLLLMLDMMDLPNSIIDDLTEYVGQKELIILLNKADLMPENFAWSRLTKFLRRIYPLAREAKSIIPISTNSGHGMDVVAHHLLRFYSQKPGHDVYLFGCTNAGKSSFMNYWKRRMGHEVLITTSITSGTTAGLLKLPATQLFPILKQEIGAAAIDEELEKQDPPLRVSDSKTGANLVDTAGIVQENQLYHYLTAKDLKYLVPTKKVAVHSLDLRPNTSYWIGGLCRIDIGHFAIPEPTPLSSSSTAIPPDPTITLYLAPKLKVYPSRLGKHPNLQKSSERYLQQLPPILWPGTRSVKDEEGKKTSIDLKLASSTDQSQMIWISGVGWASFSISCPRFKAQVYSHLGKGISTTRALHLQSI